MYTRDSDNQHAPGDVSVYGSGARIERSTEWLQIGRLNWSREILLVTEELVGSQSVTIGADGVQAQLLFTESDR